jgi:hypothetical protein
MVTLLLTSGVDVNAKNKKLVRFYSTQSVPHVQQFEIAGANPNVTARKRASSNLSRHWMLIVHRSLNAVIPPEEPSESLRS